MSAEDVTGTVRGLLAAAGLPASDDEVHWLAVAYPGLRALVDGLFTVDAARYAAPALRFEARSESEEWGE